MEIRRLTIADYTEITGLWSRAGLPFKQDGRDSLSEIAVQMSANPDFFVGAFEGFHLVGTAVLSSDLRKGWINRLAVDPDYRRRGVAKCLVEESEKILRSHGLRVFCSLIDASNKASKTLFKECGYTEDKDISYFRKRDSDTI